jgi:nucleoside phosphorylase
LARTSEDQFTAATFLHQRIANHVASDASDAGSVVALLLRDFANRVRLLPTELAADLIARVEQILARSRFGEQFRDNFSRMRDRAAGLPLPLKKIEQRQRPKADAVILTVIRVEFKAVKRAFGIPDDAPRSFPLGGRDVFEASIHRGSSFRPLKVFVAMVGEASNVPCANVCHDIINNIDTDLILLCGIAGGNRERKIRLGDVLGIQTVFYVEGGKSTLRTNVLGPLRLKKGAGAVVAALGGVLGRYLHVEPETRTENAPSPTSDYINAFELPRTRANELCEEIVAAYAPDDLPIGHKRADFDVRYHQPAKIICGEKVLVDNRPQEQAESIDRRIYGVDMESFGFALACKYRDQQWAIFRGVSDFADPKKDDGKHVSAAVSAAVTARLFLEGQYRTPEEQGEL